MVQKAKVSRMNILRVCIYKGEKCRFHGFFQASYTHGAALTIGGFPAGQEANPVAVIEYTDGTVEYVEANTIQFVCPKKGTQKQP